MNEWKTPGNKTIVKCAINQRQVVIALTGGELVYFEMDPVGDWGGRVWAGGGGAGCGLRTRKRGWATL